MPLYVGAATGLKYVLYNIYFIRHRIIMKAFVHDNLRFVYSKYKINKINYIYEHTKYYIAYIKTFANDIAKHSIYV